MPFPQFGNCIKHRRSSKPHLPPLPFLHTCDRMHFSFAPNAKCVSLLWNFSYDAFSPGITPRFPVSADIFQGTPNSKLAPTCCSPLLINFHRTSRLLGPCVYIMHRTYFPILDYKLLKNKDLLTHFSFSSQQTTNVYSISSERTYNVLNYCYQHSSNKRRTSQSVIRTIRYNN